MLNVIADVILDY